MIWDKHLKDIGGSEMRLYLITDSQDKFIALCSRKEDVDDISDYGDNITEIDLSD